MSFEREEYRFLAEIGVGPTNSGCYINGQWKARGSIVSSLNPSNNQVFRALNLIGLDLLNRGNVSERLEFMKMFSDFFLDAEDCGGGGGVR